MSAERFFVSRCFEGIPCIKDRARPGESGEPRVAALFFRDPKTPQTAEVLAGIAAKVFNDEAARRAEKTPHGDKEPQA